LGRPSHPEIRITELETRLQAAVGDSYRIQKELGGGGMSRVFLAEEVRLGRQVVIKVLPPEMGAAVNTERFEREIQLAARLQHPHIVPLLTAASSGDILYYIMPYIAGESLRAKLTREGELPVAEAAKILREVIDALSYAHRNGVVHRDIKPDNVLLSDGHAVVTDFGVAKAVSASSGSSLTSLGVALGTPAYMAPEQAAADPHVDHRADIYAVGALAYEMLTGQTPFTAPTAQGMLAAHITQTPDPVSKRRTAVSPALNALLMRSLEKRPADRWQSAAEFLTQLEAVITPSTGGMTPTGTMPISSGTEAAIKNSRPARVAALFFGASAVVLLVVYFVVRQFGLPWWVFYGAIVLLLIGLPIILLTGHFERRRALARASGRVETTPSQGLPALLTWQKAIRGGVLAFAGLGVVAVIYTAMRLLGVGPVGTLVASGKLNQKDQLVVADFDNRTADSSLGGSITEAFRIDLGQSPVVRLLTTAQISDALQRMQRDPNTPLTASVAREVASREGAKAVVVGEISALGKSYVLSARILGASDGSELVAVRETADNDAGIVAALDKLSGKIRERIGESLKTIRGGEPLEQVTTGSMEALRLYTEANDLCIRGDCDQAIPKLQQALALDSGFAMAWRKLGVAYQNTFAGTDQIVSAVTHAYQHRDRLPANERDLTEAYYYDAVDYDGDKIVAAYQRVLERNPDDPIAVNNLALNYLTTGRAAQAESLETRQASAETTPSTLTMNLMAAQLGQGHYEAAHQSLDRMVKLAPTSPITLRSKAFYYEAAGVRDSAERAWVDYGLHGRDDGTQSEVYGALARVAQVQGKLAEAERQTRLRMVVSQRRKLPGDVVAAAAVLASQYLLFRGDSAGALRIVDSALRTYPLDAMAPLDRPNAELAQFYALAGQTSRAHQALATYESQVPEGIRRGTWAWYRARGLVDLAEGHADQAVTAFAAGRYSPNCAECNDWEEGVAFERAHQPDSALAAYTRAVSPGSAWKVGAEPWGLAPSLKRLGELYQEKGDRSKSLEYYGRFVDLWKNADAVLQPQVRDVKARMAKLAGEK
jgi:tetratricopeptide (TPR) repeat protein